MLEFSTARRTCWSTTIVESGLDIPTANTIFIERADRSAWRSCTNCAGGSDGPPSARSRISSSRPPRRLTEEAHGRLEAIGRYTALGSGLPIVMRVWRNRGARGTCSGREQHGHIAAVGFDTYVRLLGEAVAEMKGEPQAEEREVRIDLPVRAFIPPGWLEQESLRLELYRRIFDSLADQGRRRLGGGRGQAEDRFGELPTEVVTLFALARLRLAALAAGVEENGRFRDQVRVKPVAEEHGALLAATREDAAYHATTKTLNLTPPSHWAAKRSWTTSKKRSNSSTPSAGATPMR